MRVFSLALWSLPTFWLGLMLLAALRRSTGDSFRPAAMQLGRRAARDLSPAAVDLAWHLVLPALALGLPAAAATARFVRATPARALSEPFVPRRAARGLSRASRALAHALRAGLGPIAQLAGLSLAALLSGTLAVEVVFAWPGLGRATYDALVARDYPLLLAGTALSAAFAVLARAASSPRALHAVLDPGCAMPEPCDPACGRGSPGSCCCAVFSRLAVTVAAPRSGRTIPIASSIRPSPACTARELAASVVRLADGQDARGRNVAVTRPDRARSCLGAAATDAAEPTSTAAPESRDHRRAALSPGQRQVRPRRRRPPARRRPRLARRRRAGLVAGLHLALGVPLGALAGHGAARASTGFCCEARGAAGLSAALPAPRAGRDRAARLSPPSSSFSASPAGCRWRAWCAPRCASLRASASSCSRRAPPERRRCASCFRHLLPNAAGAGRSSKPRSPLRRRSSSEAALSFLGSDSSRPRPSWGNMIADGREIARRRLVGRALSGRWRSRSPHCRLQPGRRGPARRARSARVGAPAARVLDRLLRLATSTSSCPAGAIAQEARAARRRAGCSSGRRGRERHARLRDLPRAARAGRPPRGQRHAGDSGAPLRAPPPDGGRRIELLLVETARHRGAGTSWPDPAARRGPAPACELARRPRSPIVIEKRDDGRHRVELLRAESSRTSSELGHVPLPPYIAPADRPADRERYQTVCAREPGAIAAPTAGLHFTDALLAELDAAGIERAAVTLHVGIGTFKPVTAELVHEHRMEAERYEIPEDDRRGDRPGPGGGPARRRRRHDRRAHARDRRRDRRTARWRPAPGARRSSSHPGFRFRVVDRAAHQLPPAALDSAHAGLGLRRPRARPRRLPRGDRTRATASTPTATPCWSSEEARSLWRRRSTWRRAAVRHSEASRAGRRDRSTP